MTDVVTSTGVLFGVALVALTGWAILDPLLAAAVAFYILYVGWRMVREAVGGLMDEAVPPELRDRIGAIIADQGAGALEAHDLRTRHAGPRTFVEFHLIVPGAMTVERAHAICDAIERALRAEIEESVITIHIEPEHKAKQEGIVLDTRAGDLT